MTPTPQAIENAARAVAEKMEGPGNLSARGAATAVLFCDLGDMVLVPKAALSRLREYKNQIDVIDERGTHDAERVFATVCTMAWPVIDAMLAAVEDSNDQG